MEPNKPPTQWVPGILSVGSSSQGEKLAKIKNIWSYTSTPHTPSWCAHGLYLSCGAYAHMLSTKFVNLCD